MGFPGSFENAGARGSKNGSWGVVLDADLARCRHYRAAGRESLRAKAAGHWRTLAVQRRLSRRPDRRFAGYRSRPSNDSSFTKTISCTDQAASSLRLPLRVLLVTEFSEYI